MSFGFARWLAGNLVGGLIVLAVMGAVACLEWLRHR